MITPSKYISELFRISCEQMGLPYVKTTTERLQQWSIDNNNPTFISLLGLDQDVTVSNSQANSISMDVTLVCCVQTTKIQPEDNYYDEGVEYWQQQADELIHRFCAFVEKNEAISSLSYNISEVFKDPEYLGIGRGLTMSITLYDTYENCLDFNNKQTLSIFHKVRHYFNSVFE